MAGNPLFKSDVWNILVALGATGLFILLIGTGLTGFVVQASNLASDIADEQPCVDEDLLRKQLTDSLANHVDARQLFFGILMGALAAASWIPVVLELRRGSSTTTRTEPETPE